MKKLIKSIMKWVGIYEYLQIKADSLKLPPDSTVLIHIGKCGGQSVRDGIMNAKKNIFNHEVHLRRPVYRKDLKYIIVARGPISRLDSAFRWRYKLVVADGVQKDRFKGEHEVLMKYTNLNSIAEALYNKNGTGNNIAQQEIRKICHIREDISFYLSDLLSWCHPDQIVAVLMQESLDEDIFRVFGCKNDLNTHRNPASAEDKGLSEIGLKNLMRFFEKDYEALVKLYCWGKIDRDILRKSL